MKAGKHQGAVGTVTSVDHGWHCVLLDGALDEPALRMRSKDIELYDSANEVPGAGAANPSTVARGAPAQVPKEEEDQLDKVLVKAGKYSGQVGYVKATQANGWHTIDVQGNLICLRVPDFERQGKGVPQMVAVHATTAENKELLNKKVILVGGKHDGKVGLVSNILNNNWHSVTVEGPDSLELRVRRSDLREYTEGAGGAYGQGNNDAAVVKSEEENEAELPTRSDDDLDEVGFFLVFLAASCVCVSVSVCVNFAQVCSVRANVRVRITVVRIRVRVCTHLLWIHTVIHTG